MIKKSVFEDEIINGMEHILVLSKTAEDKSLEKAVDYLNNAIDIFQESGMPKQADMILKVLVKIADENWEDELHVGLADKKSPKDFDSAALEKGIKVELNEHAKGNRDIATEIAMDHLTEDPRYYDFLEDMEKEMEETSSKKASKSHLRDPRGGHDKHAPSNSKQMIRNLLHHGTVFNASDGNVADDLLNADVPDDLSVSEEDISDKTFEDED